MEDKIIEGFAYALPALVTGFVAYLVLSKFIDQDNNEKKFEALVEKKRESLPLKLQAYERLLLFCERINPSKLLMRIQPIGDNTEAYAPSPPPTAQIPQCDTFDSSPTPFAT